jgi:hypothetical protein
MNDQRPLTKGWQLSRLVAPPVEARTWARNSGERICRASDFRLQSDQAGSTSR